MIGLKRGTVKLTSHHKEWIKLFKKEKKFLLATLNNNIIIEHIGSTAVPGVLAKPIIDMLLGVSSPKQSKKIYKLLKNIGYEDRGEQDISGRRLFVKGPEENRTHYLHVTDKDSDSWKESILFRDYLRQRKETRDKYNRLKKELAEKFSDNRKQYTKAKSNFIQEVINMSNNNQKWWSEEYDFFGDFYMRGDDSKEGYLVLKKQNLKQRTLTEVDGVIRLLDLKPKSKILDIPCGYGRHSIELAKKGFIITGSDLNAKFLSIAKKEAEKNSAKIQFIKENMLDINYNSEFDTVINMFYSFGFFENDEDNFKVLQNFFKALKPNGQFLMHTDINIPFIKSGKYEYNETRTLSNNDVLKIVEKYNSLTKRINGFWILKDKNNKEIKKEYSVRVYTKNEFINLCIKAGFRFCRVYSDWDKKPYSKKSQNMIVVATK